MFGKEKTIDLPVKTLYAAAKVEETPYLTTFSTRSDAENFAKKSAQRGDCFWSVYEITLVGTASPNESTYVHEVIK